MGFMPTFRVYKQNLRFLKNVYILRYITRRLRDYLQKLRVIYRESCIRKKIPLYREK